ncbi:MAG TPA: VOC family protein [Rhizomicrobium sp.]|nr:VOC family protein [Rhizomicrobium sp.]
MLDHIGIPISDMKKSRAFYDRALAPLGMRRMMDMGDGEDSLLSSGYVASGYGDGERFSFWIDVKPVYKLHFAFAAESRAIVDAFHRAAIAAGGKDNGAPGLRPHYHKDYYGAFVLDPDGHNVEAVCRKPE